MQKQMLHPFFNRSSPDDGSTSGRKYLGYIQLWKIYPSIPAEYDKSNTATWTYQKENVSIMFNEICINEEMLLIYIYIVEYFVCTQLNVKTVLYQTIPFSVSSFSMSKTVPFQTIQFSMSTYSLLSKTFLFQVIQFSQTVVIQTIQFSIRMHLVLFIP